MDSIEDFSWVIDPKKSSNRHGRNSKQRRELKQRLVQKHGLKCSICKRKKTFNLLTIDHIVRVRDGGSWNIENLRLACKICNEDRN